MLRVLWSAASLGVGLTAEGCGLSGTAGVAIASSLSGCTSSLAQPSTATSGPLTGHSPTLLSWMSRRIGHLAVKSAVKEMAPMAAARSRSSGRTASASGS